MTNGISSSSAVFAQLTAENRYTLQRAVPFLPQNYPFPRGIWTQSNTRFLEPTRVLKPNRISIGSTVFARPTTVIDRLRDHATRSVTMGRNKLYSDTNYQYDARTLTDWLADNKSMRRKHATVE